MDVYYYFRRNMRAVDNVGSAIRIEVREADSENVYNDINYNANAGSNV